MVVRKISCIALVTLFVLSFFAASILATPHSCAQCGVLGIQFSPISNDCCGVVQSVPCTLVNRGQILDTSDLFISTHNLKDLNLKASIITESKTLFPGSHISTFNGEFQTKTATPVYLQNLNLLC